MHFFGKNRKKKSTLFLSIFGDPKIKIDYKYIELINILYFNKK